MREENNMENQKKLGPIAFLPLIVFLLLYVGCGITFTLMGAESPFGQFPRHVALLAGVAVALMLAPDVKVGKKLDLFCESMGNSGYGSDQVPQPDQGKPAGYHGD